MQPFSVKLLFNGKPWVTVDLEVGHNEIGDADEPDFVSPEDANAILENLGFRRSARFLSWRCATKSPRSCTL